MKMHEIPVRLHKFVSDASGLSRRAVERAFYEGRLHVEAPVAAGAPAARLDGLVFPDDRVLLDGRPLRRRVPSIYVAFHKPAGFITTASDPHGRPSIAPWLERLPVGTFAVGRLDRATSGLLLLTDDGDLSFVLMRPDFHVTKEYHLRVEGRVGSDDLRLRRLLDGVEIGDGPARALALRVVGGTRHTTALRLVIDEGRNRVVRRMCRAARLRLVHLHRTRIGPLRLGNVEEGGLRPLEAHEVDALWQEAGSRAWIAARKIAALERQAEQFRADGRPHPRLEAWLEARRADIELLPVK